jgi:polyphenol oxidase
LHRSVQNGLAYYLFEQWANERGLSHAVYTRHGGVSHAPFASLNIGGTVGDDLSAVETNLHRAYDALELDYSKACTVWQVHSADVVMADAPAVGRKWLSRADGMVSNTPDLPLMMRFADCVPILFYDPVQRAVGIAHAGWRGTVKQAPLSTLRAMQSAYGTNPADVQACIGPSIGPDCYQVGPEVVEAVEQAFGTTDDLIRRASDGSAYLNLWEANRLALERAGVHHIEIAGICTATNTTDFFSHRAEKGKTGRFGAVIALRAS